MIMSFIVSSTQCSYPLVLYYIELNYLKFVIEILGNSEIVVFCCGMNNYNEETK